MTIQDIQDKVNIGQLYLIQETAKQLVLLKKGCGSLTQITGIKRVLRGLQWQVDANVIDNTTYTLYNCLVSALGGFGATYLYDPTVNNPQIIVPVDGFKYIAGNGIEINGFIISTKNGANMSYDENGANTVNLDNYATKDLLLQPFSEFHVITYDGDPDGTSHIITLDFDVNSIGEVFFTNQSPLSIFEGEYSTDGNQLILNPDILSEGIQYNVNILYFKSSE